MVNLTKTIMGVIALALLVNAMSMLNPMIIEGDSVVYAALSQHMVQTQNWTHLVLSGVEWLDKPHFPFWITALFFKLGGISAFTYILPGFLFHLAGAYYTYRLARLLYDKRVALIALLVYVSVFHLMYTSNAVKAEAFLVTSIVGACYYWLRWDGWADPNRAVENGQGRLKHMVLGALFAASAVMTKGVFTLITIGSGFVVLWLVQGHWQKLVSMKWWCALALTCVFLTPELWSLYLQFDSQPDKLVFGRTQVSGIRFFLWDSQFGRFFNTGPIKNEEGNPWYFTHVFIWAFLPWTAVYVIGLVQGLRRLVGAKLDHPFVFLNATFFVTFVLFSATKFQLDYYTVILYPFAAIVCANTINQWLLLQDYQSSPGLWITQTTVTLLVLVLCVSLALYVGHGVLITWTLACVSAIVVYGWWVARLHRRQFLAKLVLVFPVLAITTLYSFLDGMNFLAQSRYSIPYNIKNTVATDLRAPVYFYQIDYIAPLELCLYIQTQCAGVQSLAELAGKVKAPVNAGQEVGNFWLVVRADKRAELEPLLTYATTVLEGDWVDHKTGVLPRMVALAKGVEPLDRFLLLKVSKP